ncbi:MAG: cisplatin damage response ATP-dependent DNA ligase [Rhodospirillales bacterium]
MIPFATLLDGLVFSPQRNAKLRLMEEYFRNVPDPDRGYGLAALTGSLSLPYAKPSLVRTLTASRVDPYLFELSYDYVGDLAETVALLWPRGAGGTPSSPSITVIVETLHDAGKRDVPSLIEGWLDALDASGRYALLKLVTGDLRVGVSARLAKIALAHMGQVDISLIEEMWHGLAPPYTTLFAWLEGRATAPAVSAAATFRPLMLANPIEEDDLARLCAADYAAEWKWDGIRVQLVSMGGNHACYSRTGDDLAAAFPDLVEVLPSDVVLDGELLVVRDGVVASFNDLQQRLGRKRPSRLLCERYPAHVRLYDILFEGTDDLRPAPLTLRRRRLEAWYEQTRPPRMDLSPLLPFSSWSELASRRDTARDAGIEGLMLKRKDSPYLAGRPKGPWFKWKRAPLTADCVLMYAQRGHGKRSSYYSDYTFGCWRSADGTPELVPVGKAYFGFTDSELLKLDKWVRSNTIERFGPVRALTPALVLEIAFDGVQRSSRHKSGVAMRFPRVRRIRWDKPAAEADHLDTLARLIPASATVTRAGQS